MRLQSIFLLAAITPPPSLSKALLTSGYIYLLHNRAKPIGVGSMDKMVLDAQGLMCPMPIVKLAKKIKEMKVGETLELIADDVGSKEDVPAWCKRTGNELLESREENGVFHYLIKKRQ
jgi:tRNA 2-thiouridine synthesizing protein A